MREIALKKAAGKVHCFSYPGMSDECIPHSRLRVQGVSRPCGVGARNGCTRARRGKEDLVRAMR